LALGRCGVGTLKNENVAEAIKTWQKGKFVLQLGIFSKHPTVEPCYLDLYIKGNEKQFEISH